MIYITVFAALILLRYVVSFHPRANLGAYQAVLVFLFLFSAFRFEVGCDWTGYFNEYSIAQSQEIGDLIRAREPLWWVVLWLQGRFELPYQWINVVSSAICFYGIHILARRQPDPLGFLVLLFPVLLINMPMSAIRQGAAIGLVCVALVRLIEGRALAFGFWVLVAAGFHSSALIFVLLLPLVSSHVTAWHILLSVCFAVPGVYLLMNGEAARQAGSRYIGSGVDAFGASFRVGLLALSGGMFLLLLRRQWKKYYPADLKVAWGGSIGMLLLGALLPVSTVIADRFGYYLVPAQALILSRIPYILPPRSSSLLGVIVYLTLFLFFVGWTLSSKHFGTCYLPYRTWLLAYG